MVEELKLKINKSMDKSHYYTMENVDITCMIAQDTTASGISNQDFKKHLPTIKSSKCDKQKIIKYSNNQLAY